MSRTVEIAVGDASYSFQLDLDAGRWTAEHDLEESDFPLVAEVDGGRYELYSDGSLNEQEL
jgi:hypothetical protein